MNHLTRDKTTIVQQLWKELFPIVNHTNIKIVKFLEDNFGIKEFHLFIKQFTDSVTLKEIFELLDNVFQKKFNNEIFKSEAELEVNTTANEEEGVDEHDDIDSNFLHDKMVFELVALEQSERNKSNNEETDENLSKYEIKKIAENIVDGGDSPFKKFIKVIGLQFDMIYSQKSEVIFDSMKLMRMGKREKGDTTLL